uniref:Uncharacterized protein n=1 Tax=Oryza rufipogon TaxID=4529 RepID=A0A0E0NCJ3_ORYRU
MSGIVNRERPHGRCKWPGIGDVGGDLCSRTTRTRGSRWLAEREGKLAGTASRRASLRLQRRCCGGCYGVGEKGETGKMGSPEGGKADGARKLGGKL